MARSATRSFARKMPLWWSMASTRVVLPWSTWAIIATFRRRALATDGAVFWDKGIQTVYQCRLAIADWRLHNCQSPIANRQFNRQSAVENPQYSTSQPPAASYL